LLLLSLLLLVHSCVSGIVMWSFGFLPTCTPSSTCLSIVSAAGVW
jgi:hypothetical protein